MTHAAHHTSYVKYIGFRKLFSTIVVAKDKMHHFVDINPSDLSTMKTEEFDSEISV